MGAGGKGEVNEQAYGCGWKSVVGGSCHKCHFCCDKTHLLLGQKYAYHDKSFVMNFLIYHNKTFVTTNICRDKHNFVMTINFFATTSILLLRQNTSFVMTKVCLSRQKFCHDKHVFVMTKGLS